MVNPLVDVLGAALIGMFDGLADEVLCEEEEVVNCKLFDACVVALLRDIPEANIDVVIVTRDFEDEIDDKGASPPTGLRLVLFFREEDLSAGWGGKNFLIISRGNFSLGS